MILPDENAYVEGAKYLAQKHGRDAYVTFTQIATYVGVMVIIFFVCWGLAHLLVALPHPNPQPHYYGHVTPATDLPTYQQWEQQHPSG